VTPKLERMTRLREFWADLGNALVEADCMGAACAASMIETRFDEYCDLWPHIEVCIATNLYRRHMIGRAFAVRYMLDRTDSAA
jgi:hypothetical protein